MSNDAVTCRVSQLVADRKLIIGDGYRAKNSELAGVGLPFARAGNIDGGFNFEDADYFPERDLNKVGDKVSRAGDVVFTSKGTVGRFAFVLEYTPRFVFSPQLCYWRSLDERTINPRFLYYWMHGAEFLEQADSVKGQTDMADYVSLTDQRMMTMTLPHIEEQHAIVEVLGALDDKLDLNRKMNATLAELASALFKSWFVDFDPVVAKVEGRKPFGMDATTAALFPNSFSTDPVCGYIPEGWSTKALDQIADFRNGLALQNFRPRAGQDRLPVVKISNLRSGRTDSDEWSSADIEPSCVINDGDLVFSWSGSLVVVVWCGGQAALNQHLFKVTSTTYPKWFFQQWTLFHLPEFQAIAADKATTMGHIRRFHLTEARCVIAPPNVLNAADRQLTPWLDLLIQNELESRTLTTLRDAVLPKLLSGEVQLRQAEKVVEAAL